MAVQIYRVVFEEGQLTLRPYHVDLFRKDLTFHRQDALEDFGVSRYRTQVNNTTINMRILHASFLALSVVGFALLWGGMAINGTLDAINTVKAAHKFPDNTPLRNVYTHIPPLDDFLTTLTVFFYNLTNGKNAGPRLLFCDLAIILQVVVLWILAESRRGYNRSRWSIFGDIRTPALWGVMMNALGAAFILPIYCFRHLRNDSSRRDSGLTENEAKALPITILISATFPLMLMLPPILSAATESQQGWIALFQVTPLLFSLVQIINSLAVTSFVKKSDHNSTEKKYLKISYLLAGLIASTAHLSTLSTSVFSTDPTISFASVFLPWHTTVDQSTPTGLVMGAHLFTQFDFLIITITCSVYAYALLEPLMKRERHIALYKQPSIFRDPMVAGMVIAGSAFFLGPAATVSFAFAMREDGVRKVVGKMR
ncbi:hypothetical protein HYFRA_00013233 [Hymenoscyphus fraxineus]|uniref:Uncharacterized protein n=1 Tax=Hymenoscyphus fraxineus TaxID=746836 RepID=A0A9N9L9A2_9HELO|nr:hypothetical protein HYFRA_00013233 [Hymenoscyphus fraxineus]